jgi:hypothetical protein
MPDLRGRRGPSGFRKQTGSYESRLTGCNRDAGRLAETALNHGGAGRLGTYKRMWLAVLPAGGALATVPIVVIPDSWWYTAWYDAIGLSAVAAILVGMWTNRPGTLVTWWLLA